MFDGLLSLYREQNYLRLSVVITSMLIIFGLMIWVSILDIKYKSITFWKMLIASSSTIIMPFISSFFCGCKYLKWYLLCALFLWFFILFLNIKFNKDKIFGKADIDLLSALISECIMTSFWIFKVEGNYSTIKIMTIWYLFLLYFILGSLIFLIFMFLVFLFKIFILKRFMTKEEILKSKISVIPMFIPIAVMLPYNIMVM